MIVLVVLEDKETKLSKLKFPVLASACIALTFFSVERDLDKNRTLSDSATDEEQIGLTRSTNFPYQVPEKGDPPKPGLANDVL